MKKFWISTALIVIALLSCSLGACKLLKKPNETFFSQSVLTKCGIPDLPQINYEKAAKKYNKLYRYQTTEEDFNEYVATVYEYLRSLNFNYFGYRGKEIESLFGALPIYEFFIGTKLSDFKYTEDRFGNPLKNRYVFVWADEVDESNMLCSMHYFELEYYESEDSEFNVFLDLGVGIESYKLIET